MAVKNVNTQKSQRECEGIKLAAFDLELKAIRDERGGEHKNQYRFNRAGILLEVRKNEPGPQQTCQGDYGDDRISRWQGNKGEWGEEECGEGREIIEGGKGRYGMLKPGSGVTDHHHQVVTDRVQTPDRLENHHHPAWIEKNATDEKPEEYEEESPKRKPERIRRAKPGRFFNFIEIIHKIVSIYGWNINIYSNS